MSEATPGLLLRALKLPALATHHEAIARAAERGGPVDRGDSWHGEHAVLGQLPST